MGKGGIRRQKVQTTFVLFQSLSWSLSQCRPMRPEIFFFPSSFLKSSRVKGNHEQKDRIFLLRIFLALPPPAHRAVFLKWLYCSPFALITSSLERTKKRTESVRSTVFPYSFLCLQRRKQSRRIVRFNRKNQTVIGHILLDKDGGAERQWRRRNRKKKRGPTSVQQSNGNHFLYRGFHGSNLPKMRQEHKIKEKLRQKGIWVVERSLMLPAQ